MICALVLAANDAYGPLLCFWDEPDNYLALARWGTLCWLFAKHSSLAASSSRHRTIPRPFAVFPTKIHSLLHRKSHLEPTTARKLDELQIKGDLVGALIRGDQMEAAFAALNKRIVIDVQDAA